MGESSFMELCYILEHAMELNKEYSGITLNKPSLEINEKNIKQAKDRPLCVLFRSMLSDR
jgi:hypothetical protein